MADNARITVDTFSGFIPEMVYLGIVLWLAANPALLGNISCVSGDCMDLFPETILEMTE